MNARAVMLWFALLSIFVWQYTITHAIVDAPSGSMSTYYYGRCLLAFVIGIAFFKVPELRHREWKPFSLPLALLASAAPLALTMCPQSGPLSSFACLSAGAASTWLYFRVFLSLSHLPVRMAVTTLLCSLSISYLCRIGLGFIPTAPLPVLGFAMPFACVFLVHGSFTVDDQSAVRADASNGRAEVSDAPSKLSGLYWLVIAEFAVYGLVAGLVRTPYESVQFQIAVNITGCLLLSIATAAFMLWAYRKQADMHLNSVCQIILLLLLTVLLILVLFGDVQSVTAPIASLFARYGVYTLLLFVLCILISRESAHPYAVFGFGWGLFTLATGIGMTAASIADISKFSATVALGIVYILFIITFAALARTRGDDQLFVPKDLQNDTERSPQDEGEQTLNDLVRRCAEIGEEHGLTKREIEVIQLICLGRSKSYIADTFDIAENTVRGYAKNAYRKLGIHSRQDLLTIVGVE